ncbi:glutaredoxin family protein [Billgrantia sp. LNSP4103-1]|uniref:glutaredoxin family protein n=1 Tax=Billgrantia sp. LNSP4103-1 TaxID=3410266 RepID=UPI00403F78D3
MTQLTLYTTLGCHLCEQLEALLAVLHAGEYRLEKVEISEDEALMARYGVRIPVLVDARGNELDMGFEPARLAAWLEARDRLDRNSWQRIEAGLDGSQGDTRNGENESEIRPSGRRYLS